VRDHSPHILITPEWIAEWESVIKMSKALSVFEKVEVLVEI